MTKSRKWSNPYRGDQHLGCPMRVVIALTRLQHNPVVLEWLAHAIVREATADRVIDDWERGALRVTIHQAKRELADLEAAVEAGAR